MNTKSTEDRKLLVELASAYVTTFGNKDPKYLSERAVDFAVETLEIMDDRLAAGTDKSGRMKRAPLPDWVEWLPRDDKMVLFTKPKAGVKHTLVIVSRRSTGWIYNVYTPQDERYSFRSEGVFNALEYAQTFAERDVDWDGWLAVYSGIV